MRAVADTNIVVSAFLWGGIPRQILDAARSEMITLFTSAALIAELEDVLARGKFTRRIVKVGSSVAEMVDGYLALAHMVRPVAPPRVVRDPDDDHVIACALAAEAEIIISGDEGLLSLGRYERISVETASQMLRRIEGA